MMKISDHECTVCKAQKFDQMGTRIDGQKVIKCECCNMGVIERIPEDLSVFYNDGYYGDRAGDASGYTDDYAKMSFHTAAWAASIAKILKPNGTVLDIGCVDGFLLQQLGSEFTKYGIEMNASMSLRAQERGVSIIGSDILDQNLIANYDGKFDLITAIAVFEHLPNIRKGVENALSLLNERGILLFEVPLISEKNDNSAWFNSSLEHVFYPTAQGMHHLIEAELKCKLIGSEICVRGYASTYIGIICKSPIDIDSVQKMFERISGDLEDTQSVAEAIARTHLKLIHAADSTPDAIANLHLIPFQGFEFALIDRIQHLWIRDLFELKNIRASSQIYDDYKAVELARDFWHDQSNKWEMAHTNLLEVYRTVEKERDSLLEKANRVIAEAQNVDDA